MKKGWGGAERGGSGVPALNPKALLRRSKTMWMWHLGTWFSRRGGVGVTVWLDDLRGLVQP